MLRAARCFISVGTSLDGNWNHPGTLGCATPPPTLSFNPVIPTPPLPILLHILSSPPKFQPPIPHNPLFPFFNSSRISILLHQPSFPITARPKKSDPQAFTIQPRWQPILPQTSITPYPGVRYPRPGHPHSSSSFLPIPPKPLHSPNFHFC